MSFTPVAVGDLIAGKYLVERIVGEGGMGVVIAAKHIELEQTVAIKFLLREIAEQDMAAERFKREAWAAARIRGEHVCRVLDVGTLDSGVPYMVMEYLEGHDLASELAERGTLPAIEAVDYVMQACEALAEAHAAGVVHRDLKPANLFLARRVDGSSWVKVLDFGVSKILGDGSGLSLTTTKTLVGSPLYMSPEQLDSAKSVDARTDIWALGVVLHELLCGKPPFQGDSIGQLVNAVLHSEPPSFAERGAEAPDGLEQVVLRALNKRREDRFATIADFAQALAPHGPAHAAVSAARSARMLARAVDPAASPEASSATPATPEPKTPTEGKVASGSGRESTPVSWERGDTANRNRKRTGAMIGLGLGAVLLAALLIALGRGSEEAAQHDGHGTENTVAPAAPAPPESAPAPAPAPPTGLAPPLEPEAPAQADIAPAAADASVAEKPTATPPPATPPASKKQEEAAAQRAARRAARRELGAGAAKPPTKRPPAAPAEAPAPTISDFGGRR